MVGTHQRIFIKIIEFPIILGLPSNSTAFIVPQWGGIVIFNPKLRQSELVSPHTLLEMDTKALQPTFNLFRYQLESLLGVPPLPIHLTQASSPISPLDRHHLTGWQIDALSRQRARENRQNAIATLSSIIKLVDRIEGMPVGEAVRTDVYNSLEALDAVS